MERRLIVMRHAKSAWETDGPDHERPLNKRGRRDAPRIGEHLRELGWVPERVLSSDALRTRETWELMKAELGRGAPEVVPTFTRELYLCSVAQVCALLGHVADTVRTVMVLGHNPTWEELVGRLTGTLEPMATCNAALLEIDADSWALAAQMDHWKLHEVVRPKEL
jgi:phosphohistidine phosphatase